MCGKASAPEYIRAQPCFDTVAEAYAEKDPVTVFLDQWRQGIVTGTEGGVHIAAIGEGNNPDFKPICLGLKKVESGFIYHGHHDVPDSSEHGKQLANRREFFYATPASPTWSELNANGGWNQGNDGWGVDENNAWDDNDLNVWGASFWKPDAP